MSKIFLYHGLSANSIEGQLKIPFFMTTTRSSAQNYSKDGKVVVVAVDSKDFMDFSEDDSKLIKMLQGAGVEINELPFFHCAEITHHSPYDGTNVIDLAYLPELASLVIAKGYKGIKMTEMDYQKKVSTFIVFDSSACTFHDEIPQTATDEDVKDLLFADLN